MNSLKLLADYSSSGESEHETENLRNAIDSCTRTLCEDNCNNSDQTSDGKEKFLAENVVSEWMPLPMPAEVQQMFEGMQGEGHSDSPEQHGGKIRAFPHERGVWATFVYIEYVPDTEFCSLLNTFTTIAAKHDISLSNVDHFHISLSRTLRLRYHWIPSFVEALKIQLVNFFQFKVMLQSPEVYVNDEKTRTFVGLKVHFGLDHLVKILQKIEKCLEEFKLPFFYEDPSFHLSCVSCVGDHVAQVNSIMADLNVAFLSFIAEHPLCKTVWVKNIQVKCGNKLFSIPLKASS